MFSTPEEGGSLRAHGGWILFIMDSCGVWMFGSWWPVIGTSSCAATFICLMGLTAWSLQVLSRLWCCQCLRAGCRRLWTGDAGPEHEFEETPAVRGFRALTLTGPSGVTAADTEFYSKGVRGRGINRKPHDLVVVLDSEVARLQLDQERRGRIDRHGLWVHYSRVLGVTTRSVREFLEKSQAIHLCKCKTTDCQGGAGNHCTSYAAVASEALVDLGAYGLWPGLSSEPGCSDTSGTSFHRTLGHFCLLLQQASTFLSAYTHSPASPSPRSRCTEVLGPRF